ncbi:tetratricopeptide repeat protein [Polaromonas sp. YR568]|uniref:tetratricopeptide repeat protein n=1 Tax=Polaromonas sp. YR568 TaxID=1855301 RepID=UPI0031381294
MPAPTHRTTSPAPHRAWMACALAATLLAGPAMAADGWTSAPAAEPAPAAKPDRMSAARDAVRAGDWRKSIAELTVEVRERPGNADAHNLLAYSYRKQATPDLPKAFEHYNTALKLNPKHKGAHEYIGEAYLMSKQPAKAEEHLAQLKLICGNDTCEEYVDLAKAVADYKAKNK